LGENKIYDTSAIIELIKKKTPRKTPCISIITVIEYPPALNYAERIIYPTREDYLLAVEWQSKLRRQGFSPPATDLIIAAQAVNRNLVLVTRDKHFKVLKEKVALNLELELTP
jgi:predicted nucleic acid-binding protein